MTPEELEQRKADKAEKKDKTKTITAESENSLPVGVYCGPGWRGCDYANEFDGANTQCLFVVGKGIISTIVHWNSSGVLLLPQYGKNTHAVHVGDVGMANDPCRLWAGIGKRRWRILCQAHHDGNGRENVCEIGVGSCGFCRCKVVLHGVSIV